MGFVGIDLGTTFSVVACIDSDGRPKVIPNQNGQYLTPSVVYFSTDGPIVGDEAKELQSVGEEKIGSFFKRFMDDPDYELMFHGQSYHPVDLSSLVLKNLKDQAEDFMGEPVTHAVITVPAYFHDLQRKLTMEAGRLAGLKVLRIINEPTAAALAYGLRPIDGEQTVLVYDLGGGTFDITLVRITKTEQHVLGTGGDDHLGGKDWDDSIFRKLKVLFEDEFGVELESDDFNELLVAAERAKKSLSTRQSVTVRVHGQGHTGKYELTREQFEDLTADLMERTQRLTALMLEEINLSWNDINYVLLVGGSTRMPMVRRYVEQMSGKPPLTSINPDQAVALGAAIQAAIDMEEVSGKPQSPAYFLAGRKKTIDVISHSLGMIAVNDDGSRYINSIIIQKNKAVPCQETRPYSLRIRNQGDNQFDVFMTQGESEDPMKCAYLGKYVFSGFPEGMGDKATLDVTYAYDRNGIVNVSALERSSGQELLLTVEDLPHDVPDRFMLSPVEETEQEHLTVYLAFDLSGSMSGNPLAEAQKAALAFVSQCDLSKTSVGLISFSDSVHTDHKATQNIKQITKAVNGLTIGLTGIGNDAHPFADIYGLNRKVKGLRYAIVLTDGVWSCQPQAIKHAKTCHDNDINVVAIGFGSADEAFLRQISSTDELSFFTDLSQLTTTFSTIAQVLTEQGDARGLSKLSILK